MTLQLQETVMKQLNRTQTIIFVIGGLLMVVGAGLSLIQLNIATYIYSIGAIGFVSMQMQQRYDGPNFTARRLRRIMLLSDVLFLVAAVLMFASQGNPLRLPHLTYITYIYQKWVIVLLIAAILQLYTSHRLSSELQ
jgi:hypothetical protein